MEIQFQKAEQKCLIPLPINNNNNKKKTMKFKGMRSRGGGGNGNNSKYVGVRQRASGRWVAEIKDTTQKIRMWLGTFETAEEAARAYDEAACLLRGSNTRTNFETRNVSRDSPLASRIKNLLDKQRKAGRGIDHNDNDCNDCSSSSSVDAEKSAADGPTYSRDSRNICPAATSSSCFDPPPPKISFGNLFEEDTYKPDLSSCNAATSNDEESMEEMDKMGNPHSNLLLSSSWGFDQQSLGFSTTHSLLMLEFPRIDGCSLSSMEFSEFERIKVERQISASLYAINGVQEYMETVCDPIIGALWDFPPPPSCSLLC